MNKVLCFIIPFLALIAHSQAMIHPELYQKKPAFYSYIIGDAQSSEIYNEHAAELYLTPASCQKTITTILALKYLGTNYKYKTKLLTTTKNHKIHDLIISFSGDPTLTSEKLITLLSPLRNTKISGTIFIDNSGYKTSDYSPNIMIYDIGKSYSRPINSANIDQNIIKLRVTANKNSKSSHIVNDNFYKMKSSISLSNAPSNIKINWIKDLILANGNLNSNDQNFTQTISPPNLNYFLQNKIKNILSQLKINGKVVIVHNQQDLPLMSTLRGQIESPELSEIIRPALKISDNFIFDALYLTIIHKYNKEVITDWSEGDTIIKTLLKQYYPELSLEGALFIDGSGLSSHNRIQPKQLFQILQKEFNNKELLRSLARPGEENSTLDNRKTLSQSIYAKTGSLLGTSCLCGYNVTDHPKVFVIIANSFSPPASELNQNIDQFINAQTK